VNATKDGYSGIYELYFGIEFTGNLNYAPRNYGEMPLPTLDLSQLLGVASSDVSRTCAAETPQGVTFEEQFVTVTADGGDLSAVTGTYERTRAQPRWCRAFST
jgi:hypothetical protein